MGYKQLILNSTTLGDPSQLTFKINGTITCYGFRVVSVSFVQDWDLFNNGNNTIAFMEAGDTTARIATIPVGTYDSTSILAAVGAAMTAVGTQRYGVTYSETSRRLTITGSNEAFQVLAGTSGTTCYPLLGVAKSSPSTSAQTITLQNPMNLSASAPVLLTSRTLDNNGGILYSAGIDSDINVLAAITLDTYQDVVSWTNPDDRLFSTSGDGTLNMLDFQLVDSNTLQQVQTFSPVVITLGIVDDPNDLVAPVPIY